MRILSSPDPKERERYTERVKDFVARGLWNGNYEFGEGSAIGFLDEKQNLVAGFVYHNYQPLYQRIEISAFSKHKRLASLEALRYVFGQYPFIELKCRVLAACYSARNTRVSGIFKRLGAIETRIPQWRGDNEDEIVAVLHRNAFFNSKFMVK